VRNEGEITREFYTSEGGVIDAMENFDTGPTALGGLGATQWMTDQFLLDAPTAVANHRFLSVDAGGQPIAEVRVRCITDTPITCDFQSGLGSVEANAAADLLANTLPLQQHISTPPAGSGFSLKYFEVRRYGITATSTTGNTRVQIGAYKVFNKF
jgi:hypothetical protein